MHNSHTYVPMLKYKDAEVFAFRNLKPELKSNVVPLFQLVHQYWTEVAKDEEGNLIKVRHKRSKSEVLQNVIADIRRKLCDAWILLDVSIIFPNSKEMAWKEVAESSTSLFGNKIILVLNPNDLTSCKPSQSVKDFFLKNGIALRAYKDQLTEKFWGTVDDSLLNLGLERSKVDLILDYQLCDQETKRQMNEQFDNITRLIGWRSLTLTAGSFIENLTGMKPGNHDLPRTEWILWNEILSNNRENLDKLRFGDYTIQFPIYSESPAQPRGSRSVRYAKEEKWVVLKGQTDDAKNSAKTKQYYAHALVLVNGGIYCGSSCCWGDKFIFDISNKTIKSYGGLTTWLRVGINHHMSLTIGQLASLGQISD
ncbi:hypothetical protein H3C66_01860 [Patescibacteria group bacterium]|nr:hypothetical protein [Patescibacteria group bacterium]